MGRWMMDFKERILTTVNHQEPDRIPIMGLIAEPATSNPILGKPAIEMAAMLQDPEMKNVVRDIVISG